jgi:hypothetical protein
MTDIELYNEIGRWIRTFHNRDFFYSRLLKDFQHDCYLKLHGKNVNREYIKITCRYYPWQLVKSTYSKRMRTHREFVPLDLEGNPYLDFPDHSSIPNFEFDKPRVKSNSGHKDARKVKVLYRNGLEEHFNSVKSLATALQLKEFRVLYRYIGKPLTERFTKRKMSHIKIITYAD